MVCKHNAPGCNACSGQGCDRECDQSVTNPWEIDDVGSPYFDNLELEGVTGRRVWSSPATVLIRVQFNFSMSVRFRIEIVGNSADGPTRVVLARYESATIPAVNSTITLSPANGNNVSGTIRRISSSEDVPTSFTAKGTRHSRLVTNGVRYRRIKWELLEIPDPWEFTSQVWYWNGSQNVQATLTDTWHGASGLLGEYIIDLDELPCTNVFSVPTQSVVGTLDGYDVKFGTTLEQIYPARTVPATFTLDFRDNGTDDPPPAFQSGISGVSKQYALTSEGNILQSGLLALQFTASACYDVPETIVQFGAVNSNYNSKPGRAVWKMTRLTT